MRPQRPPSSEHDERQNEYDLEPVYRNHQPNSKAPAAQRQSVKGPVAVLSILNDVHTCFCVSNNISKLLLRRSLLF